MTAPRVALLSTFHEPCGIATYSEALVPELERHGASVTVLSPHLRRGTSERGTPMPRLWSRSAATPLQAHAAAREIERSGADVVHAQHNLGLFSSPFLWELSRLLKKRGVPFVVTLHGRTGGSLLRKARFSRALFALRGATLVVHNAAHERELPRASTVIPHGVPVVVRRDQLELKKELGLAGDEQVLSHFGFLHPDKGILEVLATLPALVKAFPKLRYRVLGAPFENQVSQAYLAELRAFIASHGLENVVHLPARFLSNEELSRELGAADWLVLNYKTGGAEGTSGAVRHALLAGRPVAVSPAPIFRDLGDAVHVLSGDLPQALERLLTDPALQASTLERQLRYCDEHAWPRVAERHLSLYAQLGARRAK